MTRALAIAIILSASAFAGLALATSLTTALIVWALLSACGLAVLAEEFAEAGLVEGMGL